jgi:hypothetical protein
VGEADPVIERRVSDNKAARLSDARASGQTLDAAKMMRHLLRAFLKLKQAWIHSAMEPTMSMIRVL